MRARPESTLVFLLMLLQVTFGVVGVRTLITLESGRGLVCDHVDSETIFVSSSKVALTTLQCRILHMMWVFNI